MEWYKQELEKYIKLYYELQTELDKLDCLRKNWTYFSMKRRAVMEAIATPEPAEMIVDDGYESLNQVPLQRPKLRRCG